MLVIVVVIVVAIAHVIGGPGVAVIGLIIIYLILLFDDIKITYGITHQ